MIDGRRGRPRSSAEDPSSVHRMFQEFDLGQRLVRLGLNANVLTATGVLLSGVFCVVVGQGRLWYGIALLIVGGLMDALDGLVAKSSGTASARGAFFDSVADRVSDALMFGGLSWYLLSSDRPRNAVLPVAILVVGSVISYERAKAESLGFIAKGGLMERTERLIALGLSMLFHQVMLPILWVTLVLTVGTAIGRFLRVWHQASGHPARIWIWKESVQNLPDSKLRSWWHGVALDRRVAIKVDGASPENFTARFRQRFLYDRPDVKTAAASSRGRHHSRRPPRIEKSMTQVSDDD